MAKRWREIGEAAREQGRQEDCWGAGELGGWGERAEAEALGSRGAGGTTRPYPRARSLTPVHYDPKHASNDRRQKMAKIEVSYTDHFAEAMQRMREDGLLLVTKGDDEKPNVMTIGWCTIGSIWGRPTCIVLVRPSRYTYTRLEQNGDFTVNVPVPKALSEAVAYCGTVSGRDRDKFADAHLTAAAAHAVNAPIVEECVVHYECRTVLKNDVLAETLAAEINDTAYSGGDYHRVYFGEILATRADEDAAERLRE